MTVRQRVKYWLHTVVPGVAGRFHYFDATVHFPAGTPLFKVICEQGVFERDIVDRLVALARPNTTVFDVGANVGLMAIPVLQACPTCRVISFEPSPNSLPYLRRTAAPFAGRWTIVAKALSTTAGELDFAIGQTSDALFEGFRSAERIDGASVIRVPVSTLDDEWRAAGQPQVSIIKIDVEGAEAQVLEGGGALLETCRPAVLLEWYGPYLAAFDTDPGSLITIAREHGLRVFTVPAGIPVDDEQTLAVQLLTCQNYLLLPSR